ncbi:hypothetical protein BDQ94DRAFT_85811 [Aspergillus welwitschiae]|uniref:Uncharacterized protein n=1 Tax=Aspergillus welwitschiae TaxID=1341132 RepID=A0A3F3PRE4_9EURO|nr:hypothetical protein BDQ94DRAFT_85811 [Aspergillus welwitschiae]RDH29423.1 hypothetical protein BDQ94DRAFT_85811 [Aspergillus welwitschiae]
MHPIPICTYVFMYVCMYVCIYIMIFYEWSGRMKEAVGGNGGMGNDVSGKEHDEASESKVNRSFPLFACSPQFWVGPSMSPALSLPPFSSPSSSSFSSSSLPFLPFLSSLYHLVGSY